MLQAILIAAIAAFAPTLAVVAGGLMTRLRLERIETQTNGRLTVLENELRLARLLLEDVRRGTAE